MRTERSAGVGVDRSRQQKCLAFVSTHTLPYGRSGVQED